LWIITQQQELVGILMDNLQSSWCGSKSCVKISYCRC